MLPANNFDKSFRIEKGFTLVELLISITIIAIVTAAIIPSFSGYLRGQNVKQAEEQVKSDLRNIQNKALTGALSDQFVGANPVQYWGIKFSSGSGTGSNRYEYFIAAVNTSCPATIPAAQLQGFSELTPDMQIKVTSSRCVFFSLSNGSISTHPSFSPLQLIVGYTGSTTAGDCRRVLFNANGLIYANNSNLCT